MQDKSYPGLFISADSKAEEVYRVYDPGYVSNSFSEFMQRILQCLMWKIGLLQK